MQCYNSSQNLEKEGEKTACDLIMINLGFKKMLWEHSRDEPSVGWSSGIHIGALTNKEARINSIQVSVMSSQNQIQQ